MPITLEPHPARETNPRTGESMPVIHNLQQVMVDGVRVAYCGVKPGQPITFIRPYSESYKAEVKAFVDERLGGSGKVSAPPEVSDELLYGTEDAELNDMTEEEDEDDE